MKSRNIDLTDSARGLLQICIEIARDKFKENAVGIADRRLAEQFARQAVEAEDLLNVITLADKITVASDCE